VWEELARLFRALELLVFIAGAAGAWATREWAVAANFSPLRRSTICKRRRPCSSGALGGLQSNKATEGRRRSDLPQLAPTPTCWYLELKVSLTRASSSVG